MEKKTIITHKSPDLDSCTAIWILKKFVYPEKAFRYKFVDVGTRIENIENSIHVDTGGEDYDHHDTNSLISSASLVYTKNNLRDKSLEKIIDYVIQVDHGMTINQNLHFMNIVNALDGLRGHDSLKTLEASIVMLDGIYTSINLETLAVEQYDNGIEFDSIFGKGMGFDSENSKLRKLVYKNGYDIFLFKDKSTGFAGFKADGHSNIDFTILYKIIKDAEPTADWFLHSSNQLLLCGSSKAPRKKPSKFTLNKLIEIIKNAEK